MRDPKSGIMDADGSLTRQLTAEVANLSRQLEQANADAAAMQDAIRDAAVAVEELDYPTQDIFRAVGKLEKLAEQGTAGAAMLRVVDAAKYWQKTHYCSPLEDALAELNKGSATCTKDGGK